MNNSNALTRSIFKLSVVCTVALTTACSSYASDSDRITQLEKEVQELKLRLTKIEAPQNASSNQQKSIVFTDSWKSLANWRSLKKGMSFDDVRAVLGEPEKVGASGPITNWQYPSRSEVNFYRDKVDGWTEPR
jgi:outer membrane protein assembly factor BamE (lipoprotein component of BamABCDE complex)